MADLPDHPGPHGETGGAAGAPLWVKVLGIVAGILILLFVILHLAFGGPGGHTP